MAPRKKTTSPATSRSRPSGPAGRSPGPEERSGERMVHDLAVRLRDARARRGMTRKDISDASGVSMRFLVEIEAGRGNPSLNVLHRLAASLGLSIESLVSDGRRQSVDQALIIHLLDRLSADQLGAVRSMLVNRFGSTSGTQTTQITLIGLRGAGKSTLGRRLASSLRVTFVELDRKLEEHFGAKIGEIIQLYGQAGYRRYEREALVSVLDRNQRCVIEPGGGLPTDTETLEIILHRTRTVWIRASPEEHMRRVMDQGDFRPMAHRHAAMKDLRAILKAREPFYSRAPLQLNTTGKSVEESHRDLLHLVEQ